MILITLETVVFMVMISQQTSPGYETRHANMDRSTFYVGAATSEAELSSIAKAARKEWQVRRSTTAVEVSRIWTGCDKASKMVI